MPGKFWLAKEYDEVRSRYEMGEPIRDIAMALGRPQRSIYSVVERLSLHRPEGYVPKHKPRANSAWPRVKIALERGPMSRAEIIEKTGLGKENALRALTEHHGHDVHICQWIRSTRRLVAIFQLGAGRDAPKPGPIGGEKRVRRANPFAVAAGLVTAPEGCPGRIFAQSMDVDDWEGAKRRAA